MRACFEQLHCLSLHPITCSAFGRLCLTTPTTITIISCHCHSALPVLRVSTATAVSPKLQASVRWLPLPFQSPLPTHPPLRARSSLATPLTHIFLFGHRPHAVCACTFHSPTLIRQQSAPLPLPAPLMLRHPPSNNGILKDHHTLRFAVSSINKKFFPLARFSFLRTGR